MHSYADGECGCFSDFVLFHEIIHVQFYIKSSLYFFGFDNFFCFYGFLLLCINMLHFFFFCCFSQFGSTTVFSSISHPGG